MSPSAGLTDHQVVQVAGAGFPPSDGIMIAECAGTVAAPPSDPTNCDGKTTDATANADIRGNFINAPGSNNGTSGYVIQAVGEDGLGVTCDSSHPCVLYVGVQLDDLSQPHTFVPIAWAAGTVAPTVPCPAPTRCGRAAVGSARAAAAAPISATGTVTSAARQPPVDPHANPPRVVLAGSLAATGSPQNALAIGALSVLLIVVATVVRRRLLQST